MPLPDIIAAVTARVRAVASAKNVYSYAREVREQKDFVALFQDPGAKKLHTWMITRAGTASKDDGTTARRRIHEIAIFGYMSVDDANNSEATFNGVIEDVCLAFDSVFLRQYGGLYDWSQPCQVEGPTVLMYGPYLCHAVKIVHRVEELLYDQPIS